ncbi:hypothetical protein WJX84_008850 [Apatococcus fuscideae]|uniref:Uncharacterized protein n=1 Tax=Apatococcus fuscideae TaxID=2026836 RepID=A0AAW1TEX4_9CHLO
MEPIEDWASRCEETRAPSADLSDTRLASHLQAELHRQKNRAQWPVQLVPRAMIFSSSQTTQTSTTTNACIDLPYSLGKVEPKATSFAAGPYMRQAPSETPARREAIRGQEAIRRRRAQAAGQQPCLGKRTFDQYAAGMHASPPTEKSHAPAAKARKVALFRNEPGLPSPHGYRALEAGPSPQAGLGSGRVHHRSARAHWARGHGPGPT